MKTLTGCLIAMILSISGCTFNIEFLGPDALQPIPDETQTMSAETPVVTFAAAASPIFTPTLVPPTTYPVFSNARMGVSPDDPNQPTSFPSGTKAVYAIWDYQNMHEGQIIKRVWYWNGQPWITREEPWDYKKYGANGTIRDISIYDNETGLNSGLYQLQLYIDNVLQPISPGIDSPVVPWITFEIGPSIAHQEYPSPDYEKVASVLDGNQLTVRDINGGSSVLYTGQEISYTAWLPDGQHILFIDRMHVDPGLGAEAGIRDVLQIADASSNRLGVVYESDGPLGVLIPLSVSPDGRHIVTSQGSGRGDACFMPLRSVFFELAPDYQSVRVIGQDLFTGIPNSPDSTAYPTGAGIWLSNTEYLLPLRFTCSTDLSLQGDYLFNLDNQTAAKPAAGGQNAGDLGWGKIHGYISNSATGAPIAGAKVTCEQHSYSSQATCSGTLTTRADGFYTFENVFFHDTDSIKLSVQAPGYQSQEVTQTAFTMNELQWDFSLNPVP